MKYICDNCEKYPCSDDETKLMLRCPAFSPRPKPITNADRIRAMTDEQLAEFIAYSTSCETCVVRKGGSDECHNTNCSTAWLGWLKQEATDV